MVIWRVEQATLLSKPVEDSSTRNGAQQIDAGHIDTGLFDEGFEFSGKLKGIFVEAVDKTAVNANTCFTDIFNALYLTIGGVVELLVGVVAAIIEAFNANQQSAAT